MTVNIRMIRERMKDSQSCQKSYHDKMRKAVEFQVDDHIFMRVTPVTGVGRAFNSRKLRPCFIGPYQIFERIGELRRYVPDLSHVMQMDDIQVKDNLTIEASPVRIEGWEVRQLRGKEIALVKVL
ncbi:uncharacterized protein LOC131604653 [Vicia villosa]|uniref:uncharacterized protein LOC131604653 n=1 Tax=Vicia villosa TaxID=3911 RepID=UPI00273BFBEF|nr:uncharacterized protein LOC131604653 [Vicia villosa]